MNPEDIRLTSVNWEHGMLLTPDHFLRQERYFDAGLLWTLRYATSGFGLVGGGPRLAEAERGAVRHDPVISVDEDEESLNIAVTQCRAITPAGCIVEISPDHPVTHRFPRADLEGLTETGIYIVCDPERKEITDGPVDEFNPQMMTERLLAYRLAVRLSAQEAPYAVAVSRLRRQKYGSGFEKDSGYIPPCTTITSLSELTSAWRKIVDAVDLLTERYTELHRAMREFLVLFSERGIDTEVDTETLTFVDRMVVALQNCAYELLDPLQPPQRFFGNLRRFLHGAAVYLDIAPAVYQYFDTLKETGETEFIALMEQPKKLLKATRTWSIHDDLAVDVREALTNISVFQRLERALEGKYVDFHISPSLESMNFVFDRGGKVLYKLAAKPARVQGMGDELSMYFSQLHLEGRDKYRLILVGEQNATFEKGTKLVVEIRLNEGSGFRRAPIIPSCESTIPEQRNFEYDFEAPDVPAITDIRVTMQAHYPIRTALLFNRHRFYAQKAQEPVRTAQPVAPAEAPSVSPASWNRMNAAPENVPPPRVPAGNPDPRTAATQPAPWDLPRDLPRHSPPEPLRDPPRRTGQPPAQPVNPPDQPPPRRRRLE